MSFIHKNFTQVLDKYHYNFNAGDIIVGTIFSKERAGYLVDIGNRTAGYLPKEEISVIHTDKTSSELTLNDTREFLILAYNKESPQLVLSIKRLTYMRAWERIKQLKDEDIPVKAYVKGINKGGVLVEIEEIQGFIPNSHLSYNQSKKNLLYQHIFCKLIVANEQNNTLICSIRCAIITRIMRHIKVGSIVNAHVMEITEFGIFFNVHNIPALLHRSELKASTINDIANVFKKNTNWTVRIIHLDSRQGRISVSLNT
uniref:Ribosomal protein S1 n=1 Tax=Helminthora furcellata TaxID=1884666 RepID=A0A1G4NRE2_9FLOR|nr:Ribosomal protein S1 [Helminthora furcellata]SCW21233.1 Ribosomal protein S1 [Helminthora furcellata]SCW24093.1 Ribosomal protein S1 [Helminthora furcellata]